MTKRRASAIPHQPERQKRSRLCQAATPTSSRNSPEMDLSPDPDKKSFLLTPTTSPMSENTSSPATILSKARSETHDSRSAPHSPYIALAAKKVNAGNVKAAIDSTYMEIQATSRSAGTTHSPRMTSDEATERSQFESHSEGDTPPIQSVSGLDRLHFPDGDIVITANSKSSTRTLRLHKNILIRCSTWFAQDLQTNVKHDETTSLVLYEFEKKDGDFSIIRKRLATTREHGFPYEDSSPTSQHFEPVKPIPENVIDMYTQLFGIFYNISPSISSTNIDLALQQTENLLRIATQLDCVPMTRPHLTSSLTAHGKALYIAISKDPARWTPVAISLENTLIFKECMIHLIGAYPKTPWPTKRATLPSYLKPLIAAKARELEYECLQTERDLLMLTIDVKNKPISSENVGHRETWVLVHIFREVFATSFLESDKELSRRGATATQRGSLYRMFYQGGSAYMEYADVLRRCRGFWEGEWEDLEGELRLLKGFVREIVKGVARNGLMIDAEELGVPYVTCARLRRADVPWLREG